MQRVSYNLTAISERRFKYEGTASPPPIAIIGSSSFRICVGS